MDKFDLVVVGEICIDDLENAPSLRPGGAAYSAYSGRKMGASTAIVGHMGIDDQDLVLEFLNKMGIEDKYIQKVPGATTRYKMFCVDEVLPLTGSCFRNTHPVEPLLKYDQSETVLFYSYDHLDEYITMWPDSIKGIDVQYEIGTIMNLDNLGDLDFVFVSSSDVSEVLNMSISEISSLFLTKGVKAVVAKFGQGGSSIYLSDGNRIDIPAFRSQYKWTVGAGDVYNAVFLIEYNRSKDYRKAGRFASLATASFIEDFETDVTLWSFDKLILNRESQFLHPDDARNIKIYLAGPFFSQAEVSFIGAIYHALKKCGFSIYSPFHEEGLVDSFQQAHHVFTQNKTAIEESDIVVALLDYEDPGTVWECGYAYSLNKPLFAIHTNDNNINLMVEFATTTICPSMRCLIDCLYYYIAGVNYE